MTTVTISLPDTLWEFVESEVAAKGHGNASEYLRRLLRDAQAKEYNARLEALLLEGLASDALSLHAFRGELQTAVEEILDKCRDRAPS